MHQSNNDTSTDTLEWTISRLGARGSSFRAWYVDSSGFVSSGYVNGNSVNSAYGVRPVFYLTSDVISSSGTGTISDPFILE